LFDFGFSADGAARNAAALDVDMTQVEAAVLSHGHSDHTGGMDYILKQFSVMEIWDNGRIEYPDELALPMKHRSLERGDVIENEKYSLTVLHPYGILYSLSNDFVEDNNSSIALKANGRTMHSFCRRC
jgi:metal-dependent hydrolase (beta-lactamase superfamily II)